MSPPSDPHAHFSLYKKRAAQKAKGEPFFILFTDIDNTLRLHGGAHADRTREAVECTKRLAIPLVAVTRLTFERVVARMECDELPVFDAIASSVGTEIRYAARGHHGGVYFEVDQEFHERISARWPRHRELYSAATSAFEAVERRFGCQVREPEGAVFERFKVSAHFFAHQSGEQEIISALREELSAKCSYPVQLTVCEEIEHVRPEASGEMHKFVVDVTAATKVDVVRWVSLVADAEQGMICGDSGNDLAMLLGSPARLVAVLVGGAQLGAIKEVERRRRGPLSAGWQEVVGYDEQLRRLYVGESHDPGPGTIVTCLNTLLCSRYPEGSIHLC